MRITPRGIAAALLALTIAAVCVRLGFWQLDRLEQRRERNAALESALTLPILELSGDSLGALVGNPEAYVNRRVAVAGDYDPQVVAVLRGRSQLGTPGVHLVSALRVEGGEHSMLVNRGWVPSADAATIDPSAFRTGARQVVVGLVQPVPEPEDGGRPSTVEVAGSPVLTLRRIHLPTLAATSERPLLPVYLQILPSEAASEPPLPVALPALDDGPHLGYAIQWFAFALIAILGFGLVALRRPDSG
jgi:surfeit locus 1 family protein